MKRNKINLKQTYLVCTKSKAVAYLERLFNCIHHLLFCAIDVFEIYLFAFNSRSKDESPISAENLYYER